MVFSEIAPVAELGPVLSIVRVRLSLDAWKERKIFNLGDLQFWERAWNVS
jgi:hypothetical protein